jgi:signal transduction histidine kinase
VAFEQDLRLYLEGLEIESSTEAVSASRHIDEHDLHRHLLDRLRELENNGTSAVIVEQLFHEWPEKLARFARYLETLPGQLAPLDRDAAKSFACRALDQALDRVDPSLPLVDRLELQRVVRQFVEGNVDLERYALENRLIRRGRLHRPLLTELGQVFLRLRGKEAIRWLATSEVVQSTGASDPWHAPHELLEEAARAHGISVSFEGEYGPRYGAQTLNRLVSLRLLEDLASEEYEVGEYRVTAAMRDVVQAVLEPGPWHTAVRALLGDERAVALPGVSPSATEATIEQTKLIAHEVRNALIPVRHELGALRSLALDLSQQRRIDDARDGVVRVLDFVEAMVQASELITEPATRCEIGAVVDEALGWIDTARRVQRLPLPGELHVVAPRTRLARAISNVVGNALQATSADQPVRVAAVRTPGFVRINVDDGGPGVPPEHRRRVFLEGVTMRKDGAGSGFGLAFARRVVEEALHGRIWCEDSDLGGARFVIELPEPSRE